MNDLENTWYSNLQKNRKKQLQELRPNIQQYCQHFYELLQKVGRKQIKKISNNVALSNLSLKTYLSKRGTINLEIQDVKEFQKELQEQQALLKGTNLSGLYLLKKNSRKRQKKLTKFNLQQLEKGFFDIYKKLKVCGNQNFEKQTNYMRTVIERQLQSLKRNQEEYVGFNNNRHHYHIIEEINRQQKQFGTLRKIQPSFRLKTKVLDNFCEEFTLMINIKRKLRNQHN